MNKQVSDMKKHLENLYKPNSKVKSFGAGWGGEPPVKKVAKPLLKKFKK
jgi:hypothetical protein